MPELVWDKVVDRTYECGLDRGVLYPPDGDPVPWNGLTSVVEVANKDVSPLYYDGMKVADVVVPGDFAATMTAITYPDEFFPLEGYSALRPGVWAADQKSQVFGLSYRTKIGNVSSTDEIGYKLHLIYNITAVPSDKTYATQGEDPSLVEFEWGLTAVPEECPGFRPTAHFIIDTTKVDPWLLEDLNAILYGSETGFASLPPLTELVAMIQDWYRIKITDNGDGTWTVETKRDGILIFDGDGGFTINKANAYYPSPGEFVISDSVDATESVLVRVTSSGYNTFIVSTDIDGVIEDNGDGTWTINNATFSDLGGGEYLLSDTVE